MKTEETGIKGLVVITPEVFEDERGCFFESYNKEKFEKLGLPTEFIQDNQSISNKGVLRGMHFQKPPYAQGKLIRVVKGKALDVAVDLRKNSSTYKKWFSIVLDEKNKKMVYIPEGFAHGFLVLEDNTIFQYKCTAPYNKESESGIIWNDSEIGINWQLSEHGINQPIVSEKDKELPLFKEF